MSSQWIVLLIKFVSSSFVEYQLIVKFLMCFFFKTKSHVEVVLDDYKELQNVRWFDEQWSASHQWKIWRPLFWGMTENCHWLIDSVWKNRNEKQISTESHDEYTRDPKMTSDIDSSSRSCAQISCASFLVILITRHNGNIIVSYCNPMFSIRDPSMTSKRGIVRYPFCTANLRDGIQALTNHFVNFHQRNNTDNRYSNDSNLESEKLSSYKWITQIRSKSFKLKRRTWTHRSFRPLQF